VTKCGILRRRRLRHRPGGCRGSAARQRQRHADGSQYRNSFPPTLSLWRLFGARHYRVLRLRTKHSTKMSPIRSTIRMRCTGTLPPSRQVDQRSSDTTSFEHRQPLRAAQTSRSIAFSLQKIYGEDGKRRWRPWFGIDSRHALSMRHLESCQKIQKSQPVKKVRDTVLQQLNRISWSPTT
jgi:hypothetical protein